MRTDLFIMYVCKWYLHCAERPKDDLSRVADMEAHSSVEGQMLSLPTSNGCPRGLVVGTLAKVRMFIWLAHKFIDTR